MSFITSTLPSGQANNASSSKSLVNTVLIFRHRRLKNRCACKLRRLGVKSDMHAVINAVFHAHGVGAFSCRRFAAECEDLSEAAHVQPFSQAFLAMSSLLAFLGIECVRAQAGILSFAWLARLVMPSVFYPMAQKCSRCCLAGSRGFCVSGTLRSFRQGLENWRAGGCYLKTCSQPVRGQQA